MFKWENRTKSNLDEEAESNFGANVVEEFATWIARWSDRATSICDLHDTIVANIIASQEEEDVKVEVDMVSKLEPEVIDIREKKEEAPSVEETNLPQDDTNTDEEEPCMDGAMIIWIEAPKVKARKVKKKSPSAAARVSPFWVFALKECGWTGLRGADLAHFAGGPGGWPSMSKEEREEYIVEAKRLTKLNRTRKMVVG